MRSNTIVETVNEDGYIVKKSAKDIEVGDKLLNKDGEISTVQTVSQEIVPNLYEISFKDGFKIQVNGDQEWSVSMLNKRNTHMGFITVSTHDLIKSVGSRRIYIPIRKHFHRESLYKDLDLKALMIFDTVQPDNIRINTTFEKSKVKRVLEITPKFKNKFYKGKWTEVYDLNNSSDGTLKFLRDFLQDNHPDKLYARVLGTDQLKELYKIYKEKYMDKTRKGRYMFDLEETATVKTLKYLVYNLGGYVIERNTTYMRSGSKVEVFINFKEQKDKNNAQGLLIKTIKEVTGTVFDVNITTDNPSVPVIINNGIMMKFN